MSENQVKEKKGWSWLGFFFTSIYYAGYGKVGKRNYFSYWFNPTWTINSRYLWWA